MGSDLHFFIQQHGVEAVNQSEAQRRIDNTLKDNKTTVGYNFYLDQDRGISEPSLAIEVFYSMLKSDLELASKIHHSKFNFTVARHSKCIRSIVFNVNGMLFKCKHDGTYMFKTTKKRKIFNDLPFFTKSNMVNGSVPNWTEFNMGEFLMRLNKI